VPHAWHRVLFKVNHRQNYGSEQAEPLYLRFCERGHLPKSSRRETLKKVLWGKWLLILAPLAAVAYLLYPTYDYYQLDAERTALVRDSVQLAQWDDANGEQFAKARASRLKLGLDLRGGMYVTLEIDVLKMIELSADPQSVDETFDNVIAKTRTESANTDNDVIEVFLANLKGAGKSLISYFPIGDMSDPTEQAIAEKLKRDAQDAVTQAEEVIRQRINKFQVSEPNIQKQGTRRIQLELPDVKDESEIRKLLSTTARLDFKRVFTGKNVIDAAYAIDTYLKGKGVPIVADTAAPMADSSAKDSTTTTAAADSSKPKDPYAGLSDKERMRRIRQDYPFTRLFSGMFSQSEDARGQDFSLVGNTSATFPDQGIYRFFIAQRDVAEFRAILDRPDIRRIMPAELDILVGAQPINNQPGITGPKVFDVYGVSRESVLSGDVIEDARATFSTTTAKPEVYMTMNAAGSEKWAKVTEANIGKPIAIVLDGQVYSAPRVNDKIPNGQSSISGSFDIKEAGLLAVVLKAGALKAPVKIIQERVVGPSLGEDSIKRGITSSLISFVIVILFMLVYYAMGGAVADLALLLNVVLVVAGLAAFGGTLTLPGIAGLILATAMAVDANILIFERIREELYAGKGLRAAVDAGFSKAWSAIIDSNLTNMLSGVVMWALGTGPIIGFAITLMLGVVMTLFTAVVVTRAIFEIVIATGATTFNFGQRKIA
jgi:SecD/SecF fusion protein